MAARFHPRQPERLVAVTGTSGKTSVAGLYAPDLRCAGYEAASVGTIGIVSPALDCLCSLTTPDPIALNGMLDRLAREGGPTLRSRPPATGLDQRRLDGLRLAAAGFTTWPRPHMDYHATVAEYLAAKLRLFTAILPEEAAAPSSTGRSGGGRGGATARDRGQELIRSAERATSFVSST